MLDLRCLLPDVGMFTDPTVLAHGTKGGEPPHTVLVHLSVHAAFCSGPARTSQLQRLHVFIFLANLGRAVIIGDRSHCLSD